MNTQKKMYKIIAPMEKKGGGTYWMRVGSAFTNRDDSINLYIDAIPAPKPGSSRFELQIRELTEEDLRKRESFSSAGSSSANENAASFAGGGSGYGHDNGGIGGGPNRESRAVTANGRNLNDVPF